MVNLQYSDVSGELKNIKANKRFDFMLLPTQRHGFGNMTEYNFWLRADHFTKHLLGNNESSVDMNHINNQIPQSR